MENAELIEGIKAGTMRVEKWVPVIAEDGREGFTPNTDLLKPELAGVRGLAIDQAKHKLRRELEDFRIGYAIFPELRRLMKILDRAIELAK